MLQTLMGFTKKELSQALRDPRMRGMLFFMPIIQLLMFGFAVSSEIRNIRLAVFAQPSDSLAWEIGHRAEGGGWFPLVTPREQDPFKALQGGEVDAALVAPPDGLTADVKRGHGTMKRLPNP